MSSTNAIAATIKDRSTQRPSGQGPAASFSLYSGRGRRKYLTGNERRRFLLAAGMCGPEISTLCLMLAWTGCRITEALRLTYGDVDGDAGIVSVRCLKKRRSNVVREIPVPIEFLTFVHSVHGVGHPDDRLWSMGRTTAWRHVKRVMAEAQVGETAASPKGLRHGFGVHAVRSGIPLDLLQRWLGHASLATTAIYTHVVGAEEREIAARMWRTERPTDDRT